MASEDLRPAEIASIRASLELTQAQLSQLLGIHEFTVSKWERGVLIPSPYFGALLRAAEAAARRMPTVGRVVAAALPDDGIARALYELLRVAYGEIPAQRPALPTPRGKR